MKLRDAYGPEAADFAKLYFYDLRNDAESVRFSYTKKGVTWSEHQTWWEHNADLCFIASVTMKDGEHTESVAVGTVRLTRLDADTCEIHFIVAPEQRGRGFAVEMLAAGREEAKRQGFKHIIARVDAPNTPSIRAFLREGYQITSAGTLFLERDV